MATVTGTGGNDSLNGTIGQDHVYGGDGDDSVFADSGEDTVYGGDGNDEIDSGKEFDTVYGGAGDDSLFADEGNDTIYGGVGDDIIDGGKDSDFLFGGAGNDSIIGQDGLDILDGGAGNDVYEGGKDADIFVIGTGGGSDTITDFKIGEDQVEVKFFGVETFADLQPLMTDVGGDTLITFDDGSTLTIQGEPPSNLSASDFIFTPDPVCYAPGTLILTMEGERPVEDLRPGDMLVTADRGLRPIRWIGRTQHVFEPGPYKHKPIEIKAGSLGDGLPRRTLIVSPQHHMLIAGPVVQELFGEREVHALAKALVGLDHIRAMNGKREVTYYSLLCDQHEVIMAEGAWSETFYPGPPALKMIGPKMRREVETLFPAVKADPKTGYGPKVRRALSKKETEALVEVLLARGFNREGDEIARWKREAEFKKWDEDLRRERMASARAARSPNLQLVK